MAPADETEVYHRMHEWYKRPECDALRAAWGAYPATPGALQAWPGFVTVTNAFLDSDAADDRSDAVAATEPVAAEAEASEPVGASDVRPEVVVTEQPGAASETMEREAPAEGGAEEPRGWVSSLLGPRRKSGAEASEAETDQAAGEAVGSVEFLGLWKEKKEKDNRLMPIEISGLPREYCGQDWQESDAFRHKLRVAFGKLVDELVRTTSTSSLEPPWEVPSGILAITNWTDEKDWENWGISWSADDERYQQLGLISAEPDRHENIRFADFDGAIDVFRDLASRQTEANAVYRVTLPRGGLRGKWAGRPPPPAPEDLYTGPRSDGLLSTGEISGDYSAPGCSGGPELCRSMTAVPLGADIIEMHSSGCVFCPPLACGPVARAEVTTRKPGTNHFSEGGWFGGMAFSADGTATQGDEVYKKRPHSQTRTFQKVDARDLAGNWCRCCCLPFVFSWPLSELSCTTKKALDEDRYAESGLRCGPWTLCLPIPVSATNTRKYVNGIPTNGFDAAPGYRRGGTHWHRDPGFVYGSAGSVFSAKKLC